MSGLALSGPKAAVPPPTNIPRTRPAKRLTRTIRAERRISLGHLRGHSHWEYSAVPRRNRRIGLALCFPPAPPHCTLSPSNITIIPSPISADQHISQHLCVSRKSVASVAASIRSRYQRGPRGGIGIDDRNCLGFDTQTGGKP